MRKRRNYLAHGVIRIDADCIQVMQIGEVFSEEAAFGSNDEIAFPFKKYGDYIKEIKRTHQYLMKLYNANRIPVDKLLRFYNKI